MMTRPSNYKGKKTRVLANNTIIRPELTDWRMNGLEVTDKNNVFVANIEGECLHGYEQQVAALIISAPVLLKALREVIYNASPEAVQRAEAAIAKATVRG